MRHPGWILLLAAMLSLGAHCPSTSATELVCDDARDDDRDGYVDCFDGDCACTNSGGSIPMDRCDCVLTEGEPVCWLDHTARTCRYTDAWRRDSFGFGGRYPVANVDVCISGCRRFGYLETVRTTVIVDDSSYTVSDTEVREAIALAGRWLFELSGVDMRLHGIDHVPSIPGSKSTFLDSWYRSHAANPPHFVAILSRDAQSTAVGGYQVFSSPLPGYCNDFVSPVLGSDRIYGAVIAWTHRFGACGYDRDHYNATGRWRQVSAVSLADGSCRNRAGVRCAHLPAVGYQICSDLDTDLPYLENARAFVLSVFIHEVLHSFGTNGNLDHFGTDVCTAAMGSEDYKAGGLHTFQRFTGMCPSVWSNFAGSFNACP